MIAGKVWGNTELVEANGALEFHRIEMNKGGVCSKHLHEFIDKGRHGSMKWLAETSHRRSQPRNMWQSAMTAIVLGCNYGPEDNPLKALNNKNIGNFSGFYHLITLLELDCFQTRDFCFSR